MNRHEIKEAGMEMLHDPKAAFEDAKEVTKKATKKAVEANKKAVHTATDYTKEHPGKVAAGAAIVVGAIAATAAAVHIGKKMKH